MADNPYAKYAPDPKNPYAKYAAPADPKTSGETETPRDPDAPDPLGFIAGLGQGVADIPEAAGQMIQKGGEALGVDPSRLVPGFVQRGAEALRQRAGASNAGQAGELIGSIAPFLLAPELEALPFLARVFTRSTLPAVLQPTDTKDPDFWKTKGEQALIGTGIGEALQWLGRAAGIPLKRWAGEDKTAQDAAQKEAQRQQHNAVVRRLNEARGRQYESRQTAQKQQTYQQRVAAQQAKAAQDAVPAAHTQDWWREALTPIGEQRRAPTTVSPESSAQVRRIIGDRLNLVRNRMNLDVHNDAGFRQEIDGIRDQIDGQLTNQAMRDRWSYMPEVRLDPQGNPLPPTRQDITRSQNSIWGTFVEQPLAEVSHLTGREMTNYVSRLGDLAEEYGRRAMRAPEADRPELEAISQGLRRVIDVIDRRGVGGDTKLAQDLANAKRAYNLWSIGNASVDASGTMTPRRTISAWTRRQGGQAQYGADMLPGGNPENARIKRKLELARSAHETDPAPAPPQRPIQRPRKVSERPAPPVVPGQPDPLAPLASHLAGHVAGHIGGPLARMVVREAARQGGRGVARPVLRGTQGLGTTLGPPAAAVGGQSVAMPQELVVTPKGAYWQDQEKR